MKKEDSISLVVYVLMIAVAVLVGILVIRPVFDSFINYLPGHGGSNLGLAFLFVVVAILFNVIFFELAHVVGAKIGGYSIFSINVLGLCFYRKEKKWKIKFANFDGLTGETKIAPKKENASPKPFALMPLAFYVFEVVVCMTGFYLSQSLFKKSQSGYGHLWWIAILSMMLVTVGGMLELYNIFPAHLDSTTDGYRLVILSKKENFEAYNELMRIEYAYANKQQLKDMKVFDKITDFTSQVNLYSVYRLFSEKKFDEAEKIIDHIIENKKNITFANYCSALAQKMYFVLLNKPYEEAKKYYETHVTQIEKRYISNDLSMQSIRAYLLISSMLDISEHEARYAISRVDKALKRTLSGRVEIEKELYQAALNKVDTVRPEWRIKEKVVN